MSIRLMIGNAMAGVNPWISWADTHSGYSRVFQFPRVLYSQSQSRVVGLEITRWGAVLAAFAFFAFFGFADEARKNYRLFASTITKRFGFTSFTESTAGPDSMVKSGTAGIGSKGGISLPVFITQQIESKRDSLDSFSDKFSTSISINDYELKVQPSSPTERSTSSSSSSMISAVDDVPRVPESILDSASVRRPSVPDAPKSVHPDNALDQV